MLLGAIPLGILLFTVFVAHRAFLPGTLGITVASLAAALRFGTARENSLARPRERHVRASAEGLDIDGVKVPRARIAHGRYQPRPPVSRDAKKRLAGSTVQLFDRYNRIVFEAEVATEEEGVALLRALGLDASQRRAEFRTASPLLQTQARSVFLVLASLIPAVFAREVFGLDMWVALPFFMLPLVAIGALPSKVVVGRDAVLVRWLGTRRSFPMSDIVSASPEGETAIRLELAGKREEVLYLSSHKNRGGLYTQFRDAVLARIREAHASHRELGPAADIATLVGQAGRSTEEWKQALAALDESDPGYRRAAVREEDLWRVVEDPRAGEDARAGAAVLLRKTLDDDGKARVRVAAQATASPKLRVALEAAADESDDAALEALDAVALKKRR